MSNPFADDLIAIGLAADVRTEPHARHVRALHTIIKKLIPLARNGAGGASEHEDTIRKAEKLLKAEPRLRPSEDC